MKKFASIVLAIMMVCTVLVMPVSADEHTYYSNETFDDMVYNTVVVSENEVDAYDGKSPVYDWAYPEVVSGSGISHQYDGNNNSTSDDGGSYPPFYTIKGWGGGKYAVNIDVVDDDTAHGKALQFITYSSSPSRMVNGVATFPEVNFYGTNTSAISNDYQFRVLETEVKFATDTYVNNTGIVIELGGKNGLCLVLYTNKIEIVDKNMLFVAPSNSNGESPVNTVATYDTTNILKALGYANGLPLGEWHKVKLLVDAKNYSYDVFINDMLVMQNVNVAASAEYTAKADASTPAEARAMMPNDYTFMPSIGWKRSGSGNLAKFAIDNLKYYNVSDAEALEIAKAGVNKFFGDGVFSPEDVAARMTGSTTLELPYGGVTGFAYYASSTDKTIDNEVHTPYESYTWSKANEVGDTFTIADENYNWVATDASKAPYFFGYGQSSGKEPYNASWKYNPDKSNLSNYSQGAVTTITSSTDLGFDDGDLQNTAKYWEKEKKVDLSVNIVKGTASETVTKTLYFKRPLEPVLIEGIEVGQYVKGKTRVSAYYNPGKTQYEFTFRTSVGNTSAAPVSLYGFVALIDENENLVRAGVNGALTIEPSDVVNFQMNGSILNEDADLTSVKGAKVFFFTSDLKPYRAPFRFDIMPEGCENGLVKVE